MPIFDITFARPEFSAFSKRASPSSPAKVRAVCRASQGQTQSGAIADQHRRMMDVAAVAGFERESNLGAQARFDQRLMYRSGGHRHRNRQQMLAWRCGRSSGECKRRHAPVRPLAPAAPRAPALANCRRQRCNSNERAEARRAGHRFPHAARPSGRAKETAWVIPGLAAERACRADEAMAPSGCAAKPRKLREANRSAGS